MMSEAYLCAQAESRRKYQTRSFFVEPKDIKARERLELYLKLPAMKSCSIQDERFREHFVYRISKQDLIAFIRQHGKQQDYKIFKRQKTVSLAISADREISQELI